MVSRCRSSRLFLGRGSCDLCISLVTGLDGAEPSLDDAKHGLNPGVVGGRLAVAFLRRRAQRLPRVGLALHFPVQPQLPRADRVLLAGLTSIGNDRRIPFVQQLGQFGYVPRVGAVTVTLCTAPLST